MGSSPGRMHAGGVSEEIAEELRTLDGSLDLSADGSRGLAGACASDGVFIFPLLMPRVYREIEGILQRLRDSRHVLAAAPLGELQYTNDKLRQVTATTEVAATDIMDAVDRALGTVDRLETREGADRSAEADELRGTLRDELYAVMTHLQFQDITTQQIQHAASILGEMEARLEQLTDLFQVRGSLPARDRGAGAPVTYDPDATTQQAGLRQALADELFRAG